MLRILSSIPLLNERAQVANVCSSVCVLVNGHSLCLLSNSVHFAGIHSRLQVVNRRVTPACATSKFFSCDQTALWMVQSVRLSVCPSVTPFWLCSHHRIITIFSGVITNDKSDVHAKSEGQRSKVKVTEVKESSNLTQIGRFLTVTPVLIHQWLWNDKQSLK